MMSVHSTLTDFANSTSLHGVPRIINSRSLIYRVFWSVICISAFLVFAWSATNLLNQYFSYPKKVNVEINQRPVQFPAVTVCNMNSLDLLVVDRLERTFSETVESSARNEFQQSYFNYSERLTSFTNYYPPEDAFKDMFQVSSRLGLVANLGLEMASDVGIKAENFIVRCRFIDEECGDIGESFMKVFDPYYFNCYTFQPQVILQSRSTRLSGKSIIICFCMKLFHNEHLLEHKYAWSIKFELVLGLIW